MKEQFGLLLLLFLLLLSHVSADFLDIPVMWSKSILPESTNVSWESGSQEESLQYLAGSPAIECSSLTNDFTWCEPPLDLHGNETRYHELQYGCLRWGGRTFAEVQKTSIVCHVLTGIECAGNRTFLRPDYPCVYYSGHRFLSHLLYSVLLGPLAIDRFCLGHTGTAVGKLLTLGGLGVWWLVDIVLLVKGDLAPADGSSWMPFY